MTKFILAFQLVFFLAVGWQLMPRKELTVQDCLAMTIRELGDVEL